MPPKTRGTKRNNAETSSLQKVGSKKKKGGKPATSKTDSKTDSPKILSESELFDSIQTNRRLLGLDPLRKIELKGAEPLLKPKESSTKKNLAEMFDTYEPGKKEEEEKQEEVEEEEEEVKEKKRIIQVPSSPAPSTPVLSSFEYLQDGGSYETTPAKKSGRIYYNFTKIPLNFIAHSYNGISLGKKGGQVYLPLHGEKKDEEDTSLAGFVRTIHKIGKEMKMALKEEIDEFTKLNTRGGKIKGPPGLVVDDIPTLKNLGEEWSLCLFPDLDKTRASSFDLKKKKFTPSKTGVASLIKVTGNSMFACRVNVRSAELLYEGLTHSVVLKMYINVDEVTWYDAGQDTTLRPQRSQAAAMNLEETEERVKAFASKVLSYVPPKDLVSISNI